MRNAAAILCVVALYGCRSSTDGPPATPDNQVSVFSPDTAVGDKVPPPLLWFEPHDLTSSVGTSPLRVVIQEGDGSELLSASDAQIVASKLSLETYPGRTPVPHSVTITRRDNVIPQRKINHVYFTVIPSNALTDQWYVLVLAALPPGLVKYRVFHTAKKDAQASYVVRVHPGSFPLVSRIFVSAAPVVGQSYRLGVYFSERVKLTKPHDQIFDLSQGSTSINATPAAQQDLTSFTHIIYDCASLSTYNQLTVKIGTGVVSNTPGAAPLVMLDGSAIKATTITPKDMPVYSGYHTWTPAL